MSWFDRKKEDPDAELKEIINEVSAKVTKEILNDEKKYYKVSLRIYWLDGTAVDYWFNNVTDIENKNASQWFKPFFKWFFHRPNEEYYYQALTNGGIGLKRSQIKFFETSVEEVKK